MRQQRSAGVGLGLALLSAVTFSTSGTFARSLFDAGWSAEAAVAARVGVAALLLAVPAALSLRGNWHVLRDSSESFREATGLERETLFVVRPDEYCGFLSSPAVAGGLKGYLRAWFH